MTPFLRGERLMYTRAKALCLLFGIFSEFASVCFGSLIRSKPSFIPNEEAVLRFVDRMIGEDLYYECLFTDYPFLKFESYAYPIVQKQLSDVKDLRLTMTRSFDETNFKISRLKLSDSGNYACATANETSRDITKLAVHNPAELIWKFIDRGMVPTRFIELGTSRAILAWNEWMPCDGCVGRGERRRLGFCYVKTKTKVLQCQDVRNLQFHIRQIAKKKKNEILIETCYSECEDDEIIFKPMSSISIPVEAHDSLEIVCPGNITTRTSVRWERQYSTMLRRDYSFGYGPAQPYYITKANALHINQIEFGNSKKILISCIVWRQDRHDFLLEVLPQTNMVTETVEHLRVMAISCSIQLALFVVVLIVIDVTKAFRESTSMNRTL